MDFACYVQAPPLYANAPTLYNMLGESYFHSNNWTAAEFWYNQALHSRPDHLPALLTVAKLMEAKVRLGKRVGSGTVLAEQSPFGCKVVPKGCESSPNGLCAVLSSRQLLSKPLLSGRRGVSTQCLLVIVSVSKTPVCDHKFVIKQTKRWRAYRRHSVCRISRISTCFCCTRMLYDFLSDTETLNKSAGELLDLIMRIQSLGPIWALCFIFKVSSLLVD